MHPGEEYVVGFRRARMPLVPNYHLKLDFAEPRIQKSDVQWTQEKGARLSRLFAARARLSRGFGFTSNGRSL